MAIMRPDAAEHIRHRHAMTMMRAPSKRLRCREDEMSDSGQSLRRLCDAFNAHDLDRVMSLFADDCVLEMPRGDQPWGSRFEGRENVRKALAGRFEGLPDVHYGSEQHFIDNAANTGI